MCTVLVYAGGVDSAEGCDGAVGSWPAGASELEALGFAGGASSFGFFGFSIIDDPITNRLLGTGKVAKFE